MEKVMAIYQLGSKGPEVASIQKRLQELGNYLGPIDGIFGGGTEAAIRVFQQGANLAVDGRVGPQTWAGLFPGTSIAAPTVGDEPLPFRCVALTGAFETNQAPPDCFAGLSGDFDGQGISFGVLQWNLTPSVKAETRTTADYDLSLSRSRRMVSNPLFSKLKKMRKTRNR
jgi:hypothetical protein